MQIIYPYNENLPSQTAHDAYIFANCQSLTVEECAVTLVCGGGSQSDESLFKYYEAKSTSGFQIQRLPLIRRMKPCSISWNRPYSFLSQRYIKQCNPAIVICSVRKQAAYLFSRKLPQIRYVYEVHELEWYPNQALPQNKKAWNRERKMLEAADLVTVTTEALKTILLNPPYSLRSRIEVVPLAANTNLLPPPPTTAHPLNLTYVGQLYQGQGLELLLLALSKVEDITLDVIGGKQCEIVKLKEHAKELGIKNRVVFHGFCAPECLAPLVQRGHVFVAPFDITGRMPFVAHTKLLEYARWGRPIIAPKLTIVEELFPDGKGVELFQGGNAQSLAETLEKTKKNLTQLQKEISVQTDNFSWKQRAQRYVKILKDL
ncbi:glycosyltransferase family 4 protein [bacterium]|nr:glycosyltransferase family 4 protein [bacterium]